jgi:multidrug resistance efflux pump
MKFNTLYFLFLGALLACFWIARDFQGQSENSFFGIAETEGRTLNFDRDIAVQKRLVQVGDWVKKGDTLAIFSRADLERSELLRRGDIALLDTEQRSENAILEKEKELATVRTQAQKREIAAQIRLLRTEDSLNIAFRRQLLPHQTSPVSNKITTDRIAALEKEMADLDAQLRDELRILDAKQSANRAGTAAKNAQSLTEIGFVAAERQRLLLIAPIDGYVESVFFTENSLVSAHRDLIKINPRVPNRIIGFIHESASVPFLIGQTVELSSYNRPGIKARGKIISSNPQMTELPLRLRKFIELRSWGREVFVQLPDSNSFFIAEKILITLPKI